MKQYNILCILHLDLVRLASITYVKWIYFRPRNDLFTLSQLLLVTPRYLQPKCRANGLLHLLSAFLFILSAAATSSSSLASPSKRTSLNPPRSSTSRKQRLTEPLSSNTFDKRLQSRLVCDDRDMPLPLHSKDLDKTCVYVVLLVF